MAVAHQSGDRRSWLARATAALISPWLSEAAAQGSTQDRVCALRVRQQHVEAQHGPLAVWQAPALTFPVLTDEHGAPASLDPFRGQVWVLNLWATWCAPCREEMPSLNRLHARLQGTHTQVIALSLGDSPAALQRFRQHTALEMPVLVDRDRAILRTWGVRILPTTIVFDASGRARLKHVGERNWDDPSVVSQLEALRSDRRTKRPATI